MQSTNVSIHLLDDDKTQYIRTEYQTFLFNNLRICCYITRNRTHLWPDAGCIHRQRPTNIV